MAELCKHIGTKCPVCYNNHSIFSMIDPLTYHYQRLLVFGKHAINIQPNII